MDKRLVERYKLVRRCYESMYELEKYIRRADPFNGELETLNQSYNEILEYKNKVEAEIQEIRKEQVDV